jgi:uncharacterized damage-inducible protein DinB
MKMTDQFLDELGREAERSARTLENVPVADAAWKPHEKSMPLGRLAQLVATMPSWIELVINQDELELNPKDGSSLQMPSLESPQTLIAGQDKAVAQARAALEGTTDERLLTTKWRLLFNGQPVMEQPRYLVIRETFNHLAHHRGQLTVYLRLRGAKVASVYGPSADDQHFG